MGNLGQHKSVGEGVQEIVLDYGPGYRIYFGQYGATLIILLFGSTKKRQEEAIKLAKRYWKDWKERTVKSKEQEKKFIQPVDLTRKTSTNASSIPNTPSR